MTAPSPTSRRSRATARRVDVPATPSPPRRRTNRKPSTYVAPNTSVAAMPTRPAVVSLALHPASKGWIRKTSQTAATSTP